MYCITDEQIEYILNDIRRNGVEMEDLQLNLLDHICCKVEQEFKENDDFERFYEQVVQQLCSTSLYEIEKETINLLTFKNYYAMKKTMIVSGAISVATLLVGSIFKTMYWPGASILLTLGIGTFSLLFLPLLFIIKAREAKILGDKFVLAIGSLVGAIFSIAILFIVQHWPGANVLLFSAIIIAALVLLPTYFFIGIQRPETKLNTILMSIILTGIIGLQFSIVRVRPSASQTWIKMVTYIQNEELLKKMQAGRTSGKLATDVNEISEEIKGSIIQAAIGKNSMPADPDKMNLHFNEGNLGQEFDNNGRGVRLLVRLRNAVNAYNAEQAAATLKIPVRNSVLESDPLMTGALYSNLSLLYSINQLQMYLALSENSRAVAVQ